VTKDEAMLVRVGDSVIPDPFWNTMAISRHLKLPDAVVVKDIIERQSQTGINFRVETIGKDTMVLDAGWFSIPERVE
jgi:hypothetical protein